MSKIKQAGGKKTNSLSCALLHPPDFVYFHHCGTRLTPGVSPRFRNRKRKMARKTVSRKKLRAESEAADKKKTKKKAAKKKKAKKAVKKKAAKKKKAKKKRRSKKNIVVRLRLFWGVFNQSMKRVALYEFNQRKQAEKKAEDLSKSGKSPHFVQRVKEEIEEPLEEPVEA